MPLRERTRLLTAAGYAPMFGERGLDDPALVVDRHWTLIASNRVLPKLPDGLLAPPLNVLRPSLHPQGLAPRILNLGPWRAHLLHRLRQQVAASGDDTLAALADELRAYPGPADEGAGPIQIDAGVYVPLQLASPLGTLSFISTITVFGTPTDITLAELALESFLPADDATATALRTLAAQGGDR